MLEPLPPLDDPRGAHSRQSAWRTAEDREDWDGFGDKSPDRRRSDPLSDFEPEYEGDTW